MANMRHQEIEILTPILGSVERSKFPGSEEKVTQTEVTGHNVTGHGWLRVEDGVELVVNGQKVKMDDVSIGVYDDLGNLIFPVEYRLVDPNFKSPPFEVV